MKNLKYIIFMLALVFSANSCQKFEDLEADPNRSTTVPPSLILRGITRDMYYEPWNSEAQYCQYFCVNYFYYGNNSYWSGAANLRYTTLKNVVKMEDEASKLGLPSVNAYTALGKFFRAYFYYDMTMRMGDLPLSQALKGSDNIAPAYDTQKDIFKQILKWLDESNTDLAARIAVADVSIQGGGYDIYFDGDLKKWQKAVNAFKLRVLAQLSKKDADGDLNIKNEFSRIVGSPAQFPLPTGNEDNLSFKYNSSTDKYPTNPDNFGFDALRDNLSATHVSLLTRLKDPRTFVTVEPASYYADTLGYGAADFRSYVGAPYDESLDAMTTKAQGGKYSLIRRDRYYKNYTAEDCIQIGYPEMCFNIAEGIQRGWASGSAADWYAKGITASMKFYDLTDATVLGNYLAQPDVALKSGNDGITQILEQKYIALFQHSGLESYFTWRRSGVPGFTQGVGTGNSGVIPRRYQYPTSERDNNTANYKAALTRQFNNTEDNINSKLWIEQ